MQRAAVEMTEYKFSICFHVEEIDVQGKRNTSAGVIPNFSY